MNLNQEDRDRISFDLVTVSNLEMNSALRGSGMNVEIFGVYDMALMFKRAAERRLEIVHELKATDWAIHVRSLEAVVEELWLLLSPQEEE